MELSDRGSLISFYRSDTGGMVGLMPKISPQAAAQPPYITMAQMSGIASLTVSIGGTDYECLVDGTICLLPRLPPPPAALAASLKIVVKSLTTTSGTVVSINENEYSADYSTPAALDGVDTKSWPWPFRWPNGDTDCCRTYPAGLPLISKDGPAVGWFSAGGVWYALPALSTERTESSTVSWADSGSVMAGAQAAASAKMTFTTASVPADYASRLSTIADCPFVYINKVAYVPISLAIGTVGTEYNAKLTVSWPI